MKKGVLIAIALVFVTILLVAMPVVTSSAQEESACSWPVFGWLTGVCLSENPEFEYLYGYTPKQNYKGVIEFPYEWPFAFPEQEMPPCLAAGECSIAAVDWPEFGCVQITQLFQDQWTAEGATGDGQISDSIYVGVTQISAGKALAYGCSSVVKFPTQHVPWGDGVRQARSGLYFIVDPSDE